jgi:manganese-dependent inorganic pyrophosphatase
MSGIISDTLKLRSPTSTAKDYEILHWLAGIAGQDIDELASYIFSSGSVIMGRQPEEVIRNDMKVYREGSLAFSVSQVEELGFHPFWERREVLEQALSGIRQREGLDFASLLVTDINRQDSLLLISGPREIIESVNYARVESHDVFELPGIVSRKKQLIPYLSSLIASLG